jgi:DNA-damage-inducible protein J
MAQTTLTVHIDADIKQDFDVFCENAGLNASVAINMFARAVLREKRIPFEIKTYTKAAYTEAEDGR